MDTSIRTNLYVDSRYFTPAEPKIKNDERTGAAKIEFPELQANAVRNALPLKATEMLLNSAGARMQPELSAQTSDGEWDRSAVARFLDHMSKTTGATLDASSMLHTFDFNGDGMLSPSEQSALIESLSSDEKGENSLEEASSREKAVEEKSREDDASSLRNSMQQAISYYESLFLFEDATEETVLFGA
ncbi:MAG: hypothetical protein LBU32_08795 [Clostridiales bacterium]|nr:hypothetical protein [Clostridiales bacterium]